MRTTLHIAAFAALLVSTAAAIAQPAEYPGTPVSTTVFVTFPHGGTVFRPPAESLGTLASAKDAAMITIRGRTSTLTPTAKDEALAFARAAAARAFLMRQGVSPLKIMVNYASAADFVADNSTAAGRIENQRVEIDLVYVPGNQ
jgi:outer membrane protein OmpA-like peptidoglycan-associated protein